MTLHSSPCVVRHASFDGLTTLLTMTDSELVILSSAQGARVEGRTGGADD